MTKYFAVLAIMMLAAFSPVVAIAEDHLVHDIDKRLAYLEGRASVTPSPAPVAPAPVVNVAPASAAAVNIGGLGWVAAAILASALILALALGFLGRSVRGASGGGGATETTTGTGGTALDGSAGRRQRFVIETSTEVAVDTLVSPTRVTIRNT